MLIVTFRTVSMPTFVADLHNHTPASADHRERGSATARDIVESALAAGLDIYAATDHVDCRMGEEIVGAAEEAARETGRHLLVVPGTELRVTYRGDEVHVVALFDSEQHASKMAALLIILGIRHALPGEQELPFFTFESDPVEVCRVIDALGGIALIAHVDRVFGTYRLMDHLLFDRLLSEPSISAVDLVDPAVSSPRLDGCRPAVISCSDSHACDRIGSRKTLIEMDELTFAALRSALRHNRVRDAYCEPSLNLA